MREVVREAREIARRERGAAPRALTVRTRRQHTGVEMLDLLIIDHPQLAGTHYAVLGVPDAFAPIGLSAHGRMAIASEVRDIMRREARGRIQEWSRDASERPWRSHASPPAWTLLSHPLLVHSERRRAHVPCAMRNRASPNRAWRRSQAAASAALMTQHGSLLSIPGASQRLGSPERP